MDATQQPQQNGQVVQPVQQPANQVVQQPVRQPIPAPQQTAQPLAGGAKEVLIPQGQPQEWVSPSTPEIVLPQEVKAAGVEFRSPIPTVPQAAQQAGLRHAKEATPVSPVKVEPLGMKTPIGILRHLKEAHKKVSDGFSWLVRLIIKEQEKKARGPII